MKKLIRLTESDLHKIVKESVNEILDDPYDYGKVNGLSAAAFKAARTPGADPKWAARKMRQANAIKDRSKRLKSEFSKMNDNNPNVDFAMSGVDVHRAKQGFHDPKGYIRRNGYGNYLKGVTESNLHRIVKESVNRILEEYTRDFGYTDDPNYNKFAQQNKPQQKQTPPLANYQPKRLGGNLVSYDDGESYIWDDSQQRQFGNNGTVEESTVNEVKYNGVSYHGTNPYDWVDE